MIKLFQTKPAVISDDVYFILSPSHGMMTHELFYNHLCLHHLYTANLHSFGITNVHDLKAELILTHSDITHKTTTFKKALLDLVKPNTQTCLFKSIKPTKDMEKYGKYLLITTVNLLEDAQIFLNQALKHMSTTTPDNILQIAKINGSFVTCINHITMSTRFQSHAQALQNMILTTIMTTIHSNAWKLHPPAILNNNAKEYPTINGLEKQCINDTAPTDISTNVNTAGDTLMMVDLDKLQSAYESKCEVLQQQIADQWTKMETM